MNNKNDSHSNQDDRLDDLLKKRVVKPSSHFTADTLARIRNEGDISDGFIDRMLAGRPVAPASDFTARTLARISRKETFVSFLRPAIAAAASVAISISGIWIYERESLGDSAPETVAVSESGDMQEIRELANALKEAEPFLDPKATETIALAYGQ